MAIAAIAHSSGLPAQQVRSTTPSEPRRLALLIGVTEFIAPAMKKHNLQGPANDVALFRQLLTGDRFRVPADGIVALAGLPADPSARPTRGNIEREFRRLHDRATAGDQILILLAGHGSQQPANADPGDHEPDGLDEIFLPADTDGWNTRAGGVTNAVVDDDIRQWVSAIRSRGASVTVIVDACHSGTITRAGPSAARSRGIPVEDLIPAAALDDIRTADTRAVANRTPSAQFDLADAPADTAALYAADMSETTPELRLPDSDGVMQGLFSYTIVRTLTERTSPITYRELVQRVTDRYRADGFNPTPSLEGAGVDRTFLGNLSSSERPTFAIGPGASPGRWAVTAGSIHGVARGSILEVLPRGGDRQPIGYVRVVEVKPTASVAAPIAFARLPAPGAARITAGSRARVRHHEFGSLKLRVGAQRSANGVDTAIAAGAGPAALERAFASLPALANGLAQRVPAAQADWVVRVEQNRVTLSPSATHVAPLRATTDPLQPRKRFEVGSLDDPRLPDLLADQLRRVARVMNLSRLASYVDPDAGLQIDVTRYAKSESGVTPFPAANGDPGVNAGDRLQFTIRNTGTVPLDVTMLYVDANYRIVPLYPDHDSAIDNSLGPGAQRALEPVEVTADPVGWESVVAIGVQASRRHENFLTLAQDGLTETRSSGPPSPVRLLLESAMFGTRSATADPEVDRGRFAITQTWFRVGF